MERLLVWTAAAAALLVLLGGRRGTRRTLVTPLVAVGLVALVGAGQLLFSARTKERQRSRAALTTTLPAASHDQGYASSDACRACHPNEYASWHRSYHRSMTQAATPETVQAPFAGETLVTEEGRRYRLERRGDELWVDIAGSGPKRITMVTGSHHMQAFWLPGDRGNGQVEFPFTYLLEERRWVGRRDVFLVGTEYSKQPSQWNRICIECHATAGQPGYDAALMSPESRVAELGIACEACHGPAARHLAANHSPLRRALLHGGGGQDATIVNPARLPAARSAEVCGQCHGISCPPEGWLKAGVGFHPGEVLAAVKPILLQETLATSACRAQVAADPSFAPTRYWKDGMVRVSGREYNGLVESPCYRGGGFSCLSCHSMHQGAPDRQVAPGRMSDAACTECHRAYAERPERHTHHAPASAGARCYNCHMPHTTYGLLRAMRSHQISSPGVASTVATGRPNACNLCHLDRTLAWTAETLQRWYGTAPPPLGTDERTIAASVLDLTRGEAGVRALTAWSMGWPEAQAASGKGWLAPYLVELLDDDYAAVRYDAARSLGTLDGFQRFDFDYIAPTLRRTAAQGEARARAMSGPLPRSRPELLFDAAGQLLRGELERLFLARHEDDQMFLAE